MPAKKVNWSEPAKEQYLAAVEYILNNSVQNAENFVKKLYDKLQKASLFPKASPPDKFKINNDGAFRAFTLFEYRISYEIQERSIKVLRCRHMKMKIKYY